MAVPDCKVRQKQQVLSGVSDILAELLEENRLIVGKIVRNFVKYCLVNTWCCVVVTYPCTRAARSPADISPGQTLGWVVSGEQLHSVTHPADTPR